MGSVQQLITIPFEDAFSTLKAAKSPKKLYFLMGSDHYLQKLFILITFLFNNKEG